jgi:hypothetical protein
MVGFSATGDCGGFTFYTDKRKNRVAFPKSPPKEPPTGLQTHRRNQFRLAALAWENLPPSLRSNWNLAARQAGLRITGYNFFVYYQTKRDLAAVRTIEQQTGLSLVP